MATPPSRAGSECLDNRAGATLLRRDAERALALDLGQAFGEALALRIKQSGRARAGDGIGGAGKWDIARQRRADQPLLDDAEIAEPANMRIAIALDQAGAFGDLEAELERLARRLGDQVEPGFDPV